MTCSRCQQPNPPQARFCSDCGARLVAVCSTCRLELPDGARFCSRCGQPATLADEPVPARTPVAYTPKHLAERILTSRAVLEGERKQVTVLFADVKGSMELLTDRDPEEARALLDPILESMMEAVHRYEGTVNQVMGDGIMALFGAPIAHEDHAVRGCYAAVRMQETIRAYAEAVRRTQGVAVQIRVGLNSGEVVVRAIGSDLHMDYTAVGQTTHLGGRMEQLALPGTILVTGDTARLAEGRVTLKPLGPIPVRGLPAPVEVYELTGITSVRSRLRAAAARGLSRFVGRDPELEELHRALDFAAAGRGQIVAMVGEPGVGKSRLSYEFAHSDLTEGWRILEATSASYGKTTSYGPIVELLRHYFGIADRDLPAEVRAKVTVQVRGLDPALEPALPALLALLDASAPDPEWEMLDPLQRRQRTHDALKALVVRESQVRPLILVVEDLHWVDGETQAFLDGLVERVPTVRILLLVSYRPEYRHTWSSKSYYSQLHLGLLAPESTSALLHGLLGDDESLDQVKVLLTERTAGNPLFLEESVRTLVETGALRGARGFYRLARPQSSIQVPPTVQAILASRIDRLAPEDKELLQAASVVGKDVPYALLAAIAEDSEDALWRKLGRLQTAEFLYEMGALPDLQYTFRHALTHEVAYARAPARAPAGAARRGHAGDRAPRRRPADGTARPARASRLPGGNLGEGPLLLPGGCRSGLCAIGARRGARPRGPGAACALPVGRARPQQPRRAAAGRAARRGASRPARLCVGGGRRGLSAGARAVPGRGRHAGALQRRMAADAVLSRPGRSRRDGRAEHAAPGAGGAEPGPVGAHGRASRDGHDALSPGPLRRSARPPRAGRRPLPSRRGQAPPRHAWPGPGCLLPVVSRLHAVVSRLPRSGERPGRDGARRRAPERARLQSRLRADVRGARVPVPARSREDEGRGPRSDGGVPGSWIRVLRGAGAHPDGVDARDAGRRRRRMRTDPRGISGAGEDGHGARAPGRAGAAGGGVSARGAWQGSGGGARHGARSRTGARDLLLGRRVRTDASRAPRRRGRLPRGGDQLVRAGARHGSPSRAPGRWSSERR